MQRPMVFHLNPRGLQWDTHMKCKRQIKITSAMILRLVALLTSNLPMERMFPRKISTCRRSSSRPQVGYVGTAPGTKEELLGVRAGKTILGNSVVVLGAEALPSTDVPPTTTALPLSMASLAGASAI